MSVTRHAALSGLGLLAVDSDPEQARLLLERGLAYPTRPAARAIANFGLARVTTDPEQARAFALTAKRELSIGGVDPDLEEQLDAFLASEGLGTDETSRAGLGHPWALSDLWGVEPPSSQEDTNMKTKTNTKCGGQWIPGGG